MDQSKETGGYLFPCSPRKTGLVPQKQNLDFLCSLFPKIACVPLFPLFLGLCSPEKIALVTLYPKNPWEGLRRVHLSLDCLFPVCNLMSFHISFLVKWFPTNLTTVRFLSSMNSLVFLHQGRSWEHLVTEVTGITPLSWLRYWWCVAWSIITKEMMKRTSKISLTVKQMRVP